MMRAWLVSARSQPANRNAKSVRKTKRKAMREFMMGPLRARPTLLRRPCDPTGCNTLCDRFHTPLSPCWRQPATRAFPQQHAEQSAAVLLTLRSFKPVAFTASACLTNDRILDSTWDELHHASQN